MMATRTVLTVLSKVAHSRTFTTRVACHAAKQCCGGDETPCPPPPPPPSPSAAPAGKTPCVKLTKPELKPPCCHPPCPPPPGFCAPTPKVIAMEVVYNCRGDPQTALADRRRCIMRPIKRDEVVVQMLLAPINPMDLDMVMGKYQKEPCRNLPVIAGNEGVGQVLEVGCAVKRVAPGNLVIPADIGFGTWRTQLACCEECLTCLPSDIDLLGAATLSVAPSTAYRILKGVMPLCPGDVIIQSAANGAVGQAIIQLAAKWGINTINIIRDRPDLKEMEVYLRSLGATQVITDEFMESGQMNTLMKTLKCPPRMAIDCVGGKMAQNMVRHLEGDGAVYVKYGDLSNDPEAFKPEKLDIPTWPVTVYGFWRSLWRAEHSDLDMELVIKELISYMKSGALRPPPCEYSSFLNYREAAFRTREPRKSGKIILKINDPHGLPPCSVCKKTTAKCTC